MHLLMTLYMVAPLTVPIRAPSIELLLRSNALRVIKSLSVAPIAPTPSASPPTRSLSTFALSRATLVALWLIVKPLQQLVAIAKLLLQLMAIAKLLLQLVAIAKLLLQLMAIA